MISINTNNIVTRLDSELMGELYLYEKQGLSRTLMDRLDIILFRVLGDAIDAVRISE